MAEHHLTPQMVLRPACSEDFDYCARLYFEGMDDIKTNPALRLYQTLGFRTTHEDERKLYMRHD